MAKCFVGGIEWQTVDIQKLDRRGGDHNRERVWLAEVNHRRTGKSMVSGLRVSYGIISRVGWDTNTKLRLYRHGSTMMLKPEKSAMADIQIRQSKSGKSAYAVGDVNVARTIHQIAGVLEFTHRVEGDAIIFMPKEE